MLFYNSINNSISANSDLSLAGGSPGAASEIILKDGGDIVIVPFGVSKTSISSNIEHTSSFVGAIGSAPSVAGNKQTITYNQTGAGSQSNAKGNEFGLTINNDTVNGQHYSVVNNIKVTTLRVTNTSTGTVTVDQVAPLRTAGAYYGDGVIVDNAYGFLMEPSATTLGGAISAYYDIYLPGCQVNGGLVGAKYGVYQDDQDCLNVFNGPISGSATLSLSHNAVISGDVYIGDGLKIKANTHYTSGSYAVLDQTVGRARLVGGTVKVYTEAVTLNSNIFLTNQNISGGTPGFLYVSARNASPSASFTILSSNVADTSIVAWMIVEPT